MKWVYCAGLVLVTHVAAAGVCRLDINATDQMRFEQQTLQVDAQCTEVEVTLHNTGKLPANIMGHDWVLTKTADVTSVANAGMGAGLANNYQTPGDKRIVAATKVIGGGETATVRFPTAGLEAGVSYSYFCSAPGHFSIMKGRLLFNAGASPSVARSN
ncbi:MAG: azu [Gammaproteobacteria bacterium]|nr:azu [Gammaproteobacteria bacterium]